MSSLPDNLIKRPDGSYVDLEEMEPRHQLAHALVIKAFPKAIHINDELTDLKRVVMGGLIAYRDMVMRDYGVRVTGKAGGFSLKSACGTMKIALEISKNTAFGPEIEAAKALIDEFIESKLEGSAAEIKTIMEKIFKLNSQGRLDTAGILGLRNYGFQDPLWLKAMDIIDEALIKDDATTYLRFYRVSIETKTETMIPLNIAKVESAA